MEGKTTLVYIVGHLSTGQMVIEATADNLAGLHQASERLSEKVNELVVAKLLEPRQQHEPQPFRWYMNARDTRRRRHW